MATQIETVMNAMLKNPSLTASQLAKQLNISPTNIYALRHVAKKRIQAQRKADKKLPVYNAPILRHKEKAYGLTGAEVKVLRKQLAEAQAEVKKLNEWCLDWRKKCESLVSERDQAQADALANRTIVGYLENRLVGLLKG